MLAEALFDARGSAPSQLIGADNEAVIRSMAHGGLGVALMREDVARLVTTLQFIYLKARAEEPIVQALLSVIDALWTAPPQPGSAQ